MEMLKTQMLLCGFFIVLVLHSNSVKSQEVDDEREFNYVVGGEIGPDKWGEIKEEWKLCKDGKMQSPIDLLDEKVEVVSDLGKLQRSYKPSNASLRNSGHDMRLIWGDGAGFIKLNGTQYDLQQFHWHSPSEHSINGKRFDLEVHMVHESPDGKFAVVAIMYKIGRPDHFLSALEDDLEAIADIEEEDRPVGILDPNDIKIDSEEYYRYIGSLTTPDCAESVIWTVVRKVRTVTRDQVNLLRVAVHDESNTNARPTQPLNGRWVKLYKPRAHA